MNPNIELRFMYNQKVDSPSVQYSTPIQNIKTYYGWYLGRMQYVGTGSSTSTLSFTLEHPEDKSAGSKVGNVYTLGSFLDSLTFSKGGNTSYSLSGTASDVQTSHDLRLSNCYWGSTTFKRNFSITYSATINVYGIALSDLGL